MTETDWLEIREAGHADKRAIVELCRRSVRNDYVPMLLDDFIDDGGLFIALDEKRVVGMMKYTRCLGGDGWLGAARTDPSYRRRGVATAVIKACMEHAVSAGARFVRSWSSRTNSAAQTGARSFGFTVIGRYRRMMRRARKGKRKCRLRIERDPDLVSRFLRGSSVLDETSGYASTGNEFVKVDRKFIEEAASAGKIARFGENVCFADANAWWGKWKSPLEFTPLAGDARILLEEAEPFAWERGKREVHVYMAVGSRSLRLARKLGYEVVGWGRDAVLFEKAVERRRHETRPLD